MTLEPAVVLSMKQSGLSLSHAVSPEPSVAPSQVSAVPVGPVVKPEPEGVVGIRVSRNPLAYPGYLGRKPHRILFRFIPTSKNSKYEERLTALSPASPKMSPPL